MIIDIHTFNNTSFGSAKRILCECDDCGMQKMVVKQSILKMINSTYSLCHRCRVKVIGYNNTGKIRSEEARRKTGLASKGRPKSVYALKVYKQRFTGKNNPNWNPDRDEVASKKRARKEAYSLIHNTLKRLHTSKSDKSSELLGYSAYELMRHLESLFLPGMSWEDRGKWHIDHVKPIAEFIKEGITDLKIINALNNLRPIWALDNLIKNKFWLVKEQVS